MQQLLCQNPTIMNRDMWTHQVSQWTPAKSPPARPRCTPPAIPRCPPERPALPHTAPQRRPSLAATSGYLDFLFLIENETVTDDEEVAMAIALAQLQCKQQVTVPSLGFRDLYACSVHVGCCDCCNVAVKVVQSVDHLIPHTLTLTLTLTLPAGRCSSQTWLTWAAGLASRSNHTRQP
jgi:hypothetical protein